MTDGPVQTQDTATRLAHCLVVVVGAALAVQAGVLLAMGQPAICACGSVKLWHGLVRSPENSQHIADWYTFSHIIHGFGFYLLLSILAPDRPLAWRYAAALMLEGGWEILENTPWIVERYRQAALAQGYFGDSVVNSLSDSMAMSLGFLLARLLPIPATVALAVAMELSVAWLIRDNLTLNIVQLIAPSEALSRWQTGP